MVKDLALLGIKGKMLLAIPGILAIAASSFLILDEDTCTSGECRLKYEAPGCLERDVYSDLVKEAIYWKDTGDQSRLKSFFMGGLCRSFPEGTVIYILESGDLLANVRFVDLPDEPNRWMSHKFFE